jgi:hypothetical protein
MFRRINKYLPLCNFMISSTAFFFQTTVLLPWHNEISKKIDLLELKNK